MCLVARSSAVQMPSLRLNILQHDSTVKQRLQIVTKEAESCCAGADLLRHDVEDTKQENGQVTEGCACTTGLLVQHSSRYRRSAEAFDTTRTQQTSVCQLPSGLGNYETVVRPRKSGSTYTQERLYQTGGP